MNKGARIGRSTQVSQPGQRADRLVD
eukprot:COSAG05_NODE_11553_length_508_cov_0.625917_1_plen_25_part_01